MNQPLVSVVTPTGRQPEGLRETLDSVAAQTLVEWEHLVVGDGDSDEDGAQKLVETRASQDPRIRPMKRQSHCAGGHRNAGIRAARAPFIVMLGAGEVLAPGSLERRAAVMSRNADLDFATFRAGGFGREIGGDAAAAGPQLPTGDDLGRFLYGDAPWMTAAPIWRRETLMRLGLFDETLAGWQHVELTVRAICAGARYLRFAEIDHFVRRPCGPDTAARSGVPLASALEAIERMEAHVRAGPGMSWVRQRALCSLYFSVAESWVERGDLGAGLAAWDQVRKRSLGPAHLHAVGAALLRLGAAGAPSRGLIHQWKGWARLRAIPALSARGEPVCQEPRAGGPQD